MTPSPACRNWSILAWLLLLLAGCAPARVDPAGMVSVSLMADGASQQLSLEAGSSVGEALAQAGVALSQIDRVSPSIYSNLVGGEIIVVTRVQEQFETRQEIIPYERQELRNESLPAGETRLVQAGANGLIEVTLRHVLEDGIQVGSSIVSETVLQVAVPEIVMVGVQSPFAPVVIPGRLAYLTGGNAWLMEESTALRRLLVTSGDLDGRVFTLSPDGRWLLYTRRSTLPADQEINTLWAIRTDQLSAQPVELGIANVVHFADWQPGETYVIAFSTVEPRSMAPGWQANNDLSLLAFQDGRPGRVTQVLEANPGGIYGWWGMTFAWSTEGSRMAYARPDSIGLVDLADGTLGRLVEITPLNTFADWAWTPNIDWGADNRRLYFVIHAAPSGLSTAEESTNFDLGAISLVENTVSLLVQRTGMFAYPAASPLFNGETGSSYRLAYLQAASADQSATSRYRIMLLELEGADPVLLFPSAGVSGLEPQPIIWAPQEEAEATQLLSVIYEGNLWLVDAASGEAQQVTGDGLTGRIDWE